MRLALGLLLVGTAASLAPDAAAARSRAAQYLIDGLIAEHCSGGGTFAESEIAERDLTGDGRADLILGLHGIACADGGMAGGCGPAACNANIYIRQPDGLLRLVAEEFSVGFDIGGGDPPSIELTDRRFRPYRLRWNGRAFE